MAEKGSFKIPKWLKILLPVLVSGGILLYVSTLVDWNGFLEAVKDLTWYSIAAVPILFLLSLLVQAYKYWLFIRKAPLWPVMSGYASTAFFFNMPMGAVTGPASLILILKRYAGPIKLGSSFILDNYTKIMSMLMVLLLGVAVSNFGPPIWVLVLFAVILLAGLLLFALLIFPKGNQFLAGKSQKMREGKWKEKLWMQKTAEGIEQMCKAGALFHDRKRNILVHFALGMVSEIFLAFPYMVIAKAINLDIPVQNWLWIHSIIRVFCMIPLTVGGLGAREGAMMLVRQWTGMPSGPSMTLSLLYSVMSILSWAILSAVFFWLMPRRSPQGEKQRFRELSKPLPEER